MELKLVRYGFENRSTLGLMFIDNIFECYTLEDERRPIGVKVYGQTCIPAGEYTLSIANWGNLNARYKVRYGDIHIGMLMLNNVPNYQGILIHCGSNIDHTEGCLLVGDSVMSNKEKPGELANSIYGAYPRLYKKVISKLQSNIEVKIKIVESI